MDTLRGCVLRRIDAEGTHERITDAAAEWYDVLADVFHLNSAGVDASARAGLWHRAAFSFRRAVMSALNRCGLSP